MPDAERGQCRGAVPDLELPRERRQLPGSGDAEIRIQRPTGASSHWRNCVEHCKIDAVCHGTHLERAWKLAMLHVREGQINRKLDVDLQDALPTPPQSHIADETSAPIIQHTFDVRRPECAEYTVVERDRQFERG